MAAPKEKNVELGFVEHSDHRLLRSKFFPSKVGGKPAWLSFDPLPKPEELVCSLCSNPTVFLLQVYAPGEVQSDFHRTIFLFICKNADCCKTNNCGNIQVYRSQLRRKNDFYMFDPPDQSCGTNADDSNASSHNKLCVVCGCLGPKTCAKCHSVSYCSKDHQTVDWKSGHKKTCSKGDATDVKNGVLFPEMEVVIESEDYADEGKEMTEKEKLEEYAKFMKTSPGTEQLTEKDLEQMASKESDDDKQLRRFKKRIAHEPEQILRYQKGGEPLWIVHSPVPDVIPNCSCGATRQFEFQVLPQLLSHLKVDQVGASLDWGTICVYTCSAHCDTGNQYMQEYVFKQDIS